MEPADFDTLIISDLHLGSDVCRAGDALEMLKHTSFRRLILLGDIFSDLNFSRLKKEHWKFLSYIRKLSNPRRHVEVVWVEGNHDVGLTNVMSHLVGVPVYSEYAWEFCGIKHLAIHGHQFDRFAIKHQGLSRLGSSILLMLQKLDAPSKRLSRFVDRLNTRWLRMSPNVCAGAISHALARGAQRVFCGHTHVAMQAERNGIQYFNSGSWITEHPSYITIDEIGAQVRYCSPGVERIHGNDAGILVGAGA